MMGVRRRVGYGLIGFVLLIGVALILGILLANESLQPFFSQASNPLIAPLLLWRLACYAALLFVWPYWIKRLTHHVTMPFFQYRVTPLALIIAYESMIVFNPLQWVMNSLMGGV